MVNDKIAKKERKRIAALLRKRMQKFKKFEAENRSHHDYEGAARFQALRHSLADVLGVLEGRQPAEEFSSAYDYEHKPIGNPNEIEMIRRKFGPL
jgi:hypothetical protein